MERLDCHSQRQYGEFAWRFGHAAPLIPRVQHAHQASQAFKAGCKADARRWLQPSSKLKLDSAGNKASAGIWIGSSLDSLCLVEFAFSAKQRLRVTTSSRACPWRPGALSSIIPPLKHVLLTIYLQTPYALGRSTQALSTSTPGTTSHAVAIQSSIEQALRPPRLNTHNRPPPPDPPQLPVLVLMTSCSTPSRSTLQPK